MKRRLHLPVIAFAAMAAFSATAGADDARVASLIGERCALCHGPRGESSTELYPRLAGQHAKYIAKQLADYKAGRRKNDTMSQMAADLAEADMKALGQYFEKQQVKPGGMQDADLAAAGKYLYNNGGHSMGGGVTMKVLIIIGGLDASSAPPTNGGSAQRVKAAVLYSSVSADHADVIARWGNGCLGDIAAGEQLLGCNSADVVPLDLPNSLLNAFHSAPSDSELMKSVSPIYHLDSITAPIQIHYGSNDGLVYSGTPPEWSIKLDQALLDAGKDVELFRYEGEGHSFVGQPWFDFMIRVLDFFDENLK